MLFFSQDSEIPLDASVALNMYNAMAAGGEIVLDCSANFITNTQTFYANGEIILDAVFDFHNFRTWESKLSINIEIEL
jgi:hypothetical protein